MKGVKISLLITAFLAVLIALGAWSVQEKIASDAQLGVARSLLTVRDTSHLAIISWFKNQQEATTVWANNPIIRNSAFQLIETPRDKNSLINSQAQQDLRTWFKGIKAATRYRGYFIVGPDNINLASSRDQNIGIENLLVQQPYFLDEIWNGKTAVSLPQKSDVPLTDSHGHLISGLASMFVATPIQDNNNKIIAIFMFRLDPEAGFTNILQQGRIGNSGETYAFDKNGRLISHSRFENELQQYGLIANNEHSILNIEIRDPGANLFNGEKSSFPLNKQPFTRMAESAIRGESGMDLSGYNDYRGVPVVGSWIWDKNLNLGIAVEIDHDEAFHALRSTQLAIILFSTLIFFLLMGLNLIYTLLRQRKFAELQIKRERDKAQLYLDTVDTVIVALDTQGKVSLINNKACELLGYKEEELIGQNWFTSCLPKEHQDDVLRLFSAIMDGKLENTEYYENQVVTRSGEYKLIAWHNTTLTDEDQNITGSLSAGEDITVRKQIENELRRAAIVFDNTDEGILMTDSDANIILVNKSFTDITGYTPEDAIGKNPRFQKSGRHDREFYSRLWKELNENGEWRGELWNRRKNGEIYPAWENINIVKDEHGNITNYVAIFSDISVFKESEDRLHHLAHHDTLTGLPNRLRFTANLEQALESAKRHQNFVALMFLDLDKFKEINDTFGHDVGDELLKTVAERLKLCVRAEDTVARLGGDEFTIILTEISHIEDAALIASKVVKAISMPIIINENPIDTSVSVGISIFPNDADDYEGILRTADTAMYHSKTNGRNNYCFYSDTNS